jgi:hypothetical protein
VDARATYVEGKERRARDVAACERRSRAIGTLRLLVAAGAIALLGAMIWTQLPRALYWGEALFAIAFGALVFVHARVSREQERAEAALRFHERGLARVDGKWTELTPDGARFRSAEHPYEGDLDIFGRASLFQRIDATETHFGEERLAALLSRTDVRGWPDDVRARQAAVRELREKVAFRESLSALGAIALASKPDPAPFLKWAEGSRPFVHGGALRFAARLVPAIGIALLAVGTEMRAVRFALAGVVLVDLLIIAATRGHTAPIAAIVSAREAGFARFGDMFAAVEAERFEAPLLVAIQARLRSETASATSEMRALARILSFLEARNNEVWRFFIGPFLLWDLNCVIALERWRLRAGAKIRDWFAALGELEALASLAGYAFERDDHTFPELDDAPIFEARGLGHPLLDTKARVDNDVALERAGRALIVTGSNMSGKSTLLRAMGINTALALAGAPVCARALRIGPLRVATSMRISESLEQGVSHVSAELKKLKRVIDMARTKDEGTLLFLLDEILHGTNSRERILGARAIVRELVGRGAMGAVSTHDLGISDLESELAGVVSNVHFEEQVDGDKMTFDYRLRHGIVKSSNALRLMRMVGIDVVHIEG